MIKGTDGTGMLPQHYSAMWRLVRAAAGGLLLWDPPSDVDSGEV